MTTMAGKTTFHTTRVVRGLANLVRGWMKADFDDEVDDIGLLPADDMLVWVDRWIVRHPEWDLAKVWPTVTPELRAELMAAWPHLRGPTNREHAEAWAERRNQRIRDRAPLFASADAINEIDRIWTVEDLLLEQESLRDRSRRMHEADKHRLTGEQKARLRSQQQPDEPRDGNIGFSMVQLWIWRELHRYNAVPDFEAAVAKLIEHSRDSADKARFDLCVIAIHAGNRIAKQRDAGKWDRDFDLMSYQSMVNGLEAVYEIWDTMHACLLSPVLP